MLHEVKTPIQKLEKYTTQSSQNLISKKQFEEIKKLAYPLKGLKVNLINSTPKGGGVAEILKSLVPLMKGLGLNAKWYTIPPNKKFFEVTKQIHNALQGKNYEFPLTHQKIYLNHIKKTSQLMKDMKADIWVIHDPQPSGIIKFLPRIHPSICRVHIDLTSPNKKVWNFISNFLKDYDRVIVTSKEFVKPEIERKTVIIPPAIDPLTVKNIPISIKKARRILEKYGISSQRPLISQISRFDPWKDPLGVIQAYRIAKKKIPNLQLALIGFFIANDDPEAIEVYNNIKKEIKDDPDIFLFSDLKCLGKLKVQTFVNAAQVASTLIIQKSIREGFALTVTEAMWKEKAIIGKKVGGIKIQIKNGENGFLVSSPEETAKRIIEIIQNPKLAKRIGKKAKISVRKNFLMPRLLKDYLKLFKELS